MTTLKVKQPEGAEVPTEVLADSILRISEGIRKLRGGRLNDRALLLLIQDAAPAAGKYQTAVLPLKTIERVLQGIEGLEAAFLRKPAKK